MSGMLKRKREDKAEEEIKKCLSNFLESLEKMNLKNEKNFLLLSKNSKYIINIVSAFKGLVALELASQKNVELLIQHGEHAGNLDFGLHVLKDIELHAPQYWALFIKEASDPSKLFKLLALFKTLGTSTNYDTLFRYRDFLSTIHDHLFPPHHLFLTSTSFSQSDFDQVIAQVKAEWEAQNSAFVMGMHARVGAQSAIRFFKKENCSMAETKAITHIFDFLPKPR